MEKKEGNSIFTNYKFYMGIIIILLLVIIYLLIDGRKNDVGTPAMQGQVEQQGTPEEMQTEAPETNAPADAEGTQPEAEPENNLEENTHASVDRLVEEYCEYIASGYFDV